MSESDGEQAARSVALEQAYVHEVYEQCAERTAQCRHHWPRIYQFLEELEPGALVCDIGCGNGKYLNVNHNIFKVGVDRCKRFADIAREKENEVLICDNLALPFRDESFDAVLSIAVVHHFATTERRVHALKELARVLRIGGRLVISVWAMEQRHRKFESQDVLVPWPKAYCTNASSDDLKSSCTAHPCDRYRSQSAQKYLSKRASQQKGRNRGYWIDPILSPSPSTSSLSSPNETCYSFFRRALQKLAGGKRGSGSRPWFLDSWQNSNGKHRRHCEPDDDIADVDELPIELRQLEDVHVTINKQPDSLSIKSKSVGDILEIQRYDIVRSRSSIPGLCSTVTSESNLTDQSKTSSLSGSKPRLVKQKSHFVDDVGLEIPENTAIQLIEDLPDVEATPRRYSKKRIVAKQCSMNEELMSVDRLEEKERLRRNIMKQASLNEEIICKRKTFESLKDSIYSGNATKKFQLLKSGLTNKIKQSTTNIEKVSSMSIKNGFVRILQSWKSGEEDAPIDSNETGCDATTVAKPNDKIQPVVTIKRENNMENIERRPSREDGSDSSKDSSLQSDTSVDSEDSIASVIYVPKQDVPSLIDVISAPSGYHLSTMSAPPSPRVKHPPDLSGPRMKLITISPLLKQFPATSKSLPPPSPPGLSPRTFGSVSARTFFGGNTLGNQQSETRNLSLEKKPSITKSDALTNDKIPDTSKNSVSTEKSSSNNDKLTDGATSARKNDNGANEYGHTKNNEIKNYKTTNTIKNDSVAPAKSVNSTKSDTTAGKNLISLPSSKKIGSLEDYSKSLLGGRKPNLQVIRGSRSMSETVDSDEPTVTEETAPLICNPEETTDKATQDKSGIDLINEDESRRLRLNQIKELLKQKPGFATRTKTSFPLVRRASTAASGRLETVTRVLPRLLSLELFNPETDDLDSDSSGVSSPESVGSVISVISDERYTLKKASDAAKTETSNSADGSAIKANKSLTTRTVCDASQDTTTKSTSIEEGGLEKTSSTSLRLIEAAANVASSLENAVGRAIQLKSNSETGIRKTVVRQSSMFECQKSTKILLGNTSRTKHQSLDDCKEVPPLETTWNEQCRKQLNDFTEKLGENLIHDIDEYCQKAKREFAQNIEAMENGGRLLAEKKQDGSEASGKEDANPTSVVSAQESHSRSSRKFQEFANTIAWLNSSNLDNAEKPVNESFEADTWVADVNKANQMDYDASMDRSTSDDIMDFVMVSKNGEFMNETETVPKQKIAQEKLRSRNSIESSDIGDSIENTISLSDGSQTGSTGTTGRFCSGSTASLKSTNVDSARSTTEKRRLQAQRRSASEEIPPRLPSTKQSTECLLTTGSNGTLSGSSSQESLPSDRGGGAITYHQYYHVFREGELDQLINKYVENLHIISSYYDHASWCIVAEKVQVWTI